LNKQIKFFVLPIPPSLHPPPPSKSSLGEREGGTKKCELRIYCRVFSLDSILTAFLCKILERRGEQIITTDYKYEKIKFKKT